MLLLERRDLVARHLSSQLARRSQRHHSFNKIIRDEIAPFEVDIAALEQEIALIRTQYATIRQVFSSHSRFLPLVYEDLLLDIGPDDKFRFSGELIERLAALLRVAPTFDLAPRLKKMSLPGYNHIVLNIDEVRALAARQMD